jgi:hypothetical protein
MFLVGSFLCDDLDGIVNEIFELEKGLYGACLVGHCRRDRRRDCDAVVGETKNLITEPPSVQVGVPQIIMINTIGHKPGYNQIHPL